MIKRKRGRAGRMIGSTPKLKVDRALRALVPTPGEEERAELERSLKAEGCHDMLKAWKRKSREDPILLDGHQRYEICRRHGIPFAVTLLDLPNRDAAKVWIIRNQLGRRNLTPAQRIQLALELKPLLGMQARERQRKGGRQKVVQNSGQASRTERQLAKLAGVSHDTVAKAEKVLTGDDEETKSRYLRGELSTDAAYKKVAPKRDQKRKPPCRLGEVMKPGQYVPKAQSAARLDAVLKLRMRLEAELDVPADKLIRAVDDLFHHIAARDEEIKDLKHKCRYGIGLKAERDGKKKK